MTSVLPIVRRNALSILAGLLVCGLIVSFVGVAPSTLLSTISSGTVGDQGAVLNVLRWSTPEIIVGLAFAVSQRAGLFNLGINGQLYLGALAAALVGIYAPLPPVIAPVVAIASGMLAGALWAGLAGWLLNRFGVTEVVSTLMLNYVGTLVTTWLIKMYFLQKLGGQASYTIATAPIRPQAALPLFSPASQANAGLLLALGAAGLLWFVTQRSRAGYQLRSVGASTSFAAYDGQDVARTRLAALTASGAIAGLAGAVEVLGVQHNFVAGFAQSLGFDGIIVSIIGGHNPLGIVFSGAFFGALKNVGLQLSLSGNVSSYAVTLLTAVFIFAFSLRIPLRRKAR